MIFCGVMDEGLVILGANRNGAHAFPDQHLIDIPSVDSVDGTTPIKAGDFAVLCDVAVNSSATLPTAVTPTGWSIISSGSGTTSDGDGVRVVVSRKTLTASDPGTTITGMVGANYARKILAVFRASRPIISVSVADNTLSISSGDPGSVAIASDDGAGNVLAVGFAVSENTITAAQFSWSPSETGTTYTDPADATDATGATAGSQTRAHYSFYPRGVTPAGHTIDMPDLGTINVLAGQYFTLS